MTPYQLLKLNFKRIFHLYSIQNIMMWDEAVMMPEGAGPARAKMMGTLNRITQDSLKKRKMERYLAAAEQDTTLSNWDKANLNWMKKKIVAASCLPLSLTEELTQTTLASEQAWRKLRAANNWKEYQPYLEKTFALVKEVTKRKSEISGLNLYDTLLDEYAPGFNQKNIDPTFDGLKKLLPDLLKQILQKQSKISTTPLTGHFAIEKQKNLGLACMQAMQFNFNQGRLDISHHPFCGGGESDIRITTRYREDEFLSSLMGICHETGHALYEQGLPKKWQFQPVGHVNSMAMHESQSLLMEMEVCRSPEFFQFLTPLIHEQFGKQDAFTPENLFQLATHVNPDFIRVDADEVTYPMHIILRYEIEKQLLNGEITINDLPARWNELMLKYLGISTLGNDANGVMQDVHWPSGAFGYFPAYTLGRMIASQLFASFIKKHPHFFNEIKKGNFQLLHSWLSANVYKQASSLSTDALLNKLTGETLNPEYFIKGIKQRYL